MIEQVKCNCFLLKKTFEKQRKTIEDQEKNKLRLCNLQMQIKKLIKDLVPKELLNKDSNNEINKMEIRERQTIRDDLICKTVVKKHKMCDF